MDMRRLRRDPELPRARPKTLQHMRPVHCRLLFGYIDAKQVSTLCAAKRLPCRSVLERGGREMREMQAGFLCAVRRVQGMFKVRERRNAARAL